jgi:hypothetical protein
MSGHFPHTAGLFHGFINHQIQVITVQVIGDGEVVRLSFRVLEKGEAFWVSTSSSLLGVTSSFFIKISTLSLRMPFEVLKGNQSDNYKHRRNYNNCPHIYPSLSGGMVFTPIANKTTENNTPNTIAIQFINSLLNKPLIATVVARYLDRSRNTLPASFLRSLFIIHYITT